MDKNSIYEERADEKGFLRLRKYEEFGGALEMYFPHFHKSYEIVLVTEGQCGVRINGVEYIYHAGDICFIESHAPHKFHYVGDNVRYLLLFDLQFVKELGGKFDNFLPKTECSEKLKNLFETFPTEYLKNNEYMKTALVNMALGYLVEYYSLIPTDNKKTTEYEWVSKTMQYINTHYAEDISLEFLAEKYGFSQNYFSSTFNKLTGINLRDYLNRCRYSAFQKESEKNTGESVSEIAWRCGFGSMNTFYRVQQKYNKEKNNK